MKTYLFILAFFAANIANAGLSYSSYDLNFDGKVDDYDKFELYVDWWDWIHGGKITGDVNERSDFDGDGRYTIQDQAMLLAKYGTYPAVAVPNLYTTPPVYSSYLNQYWTTAAFTIYWTHDNALNANAEVIVQESRYEDFGIVDWQFSSTQGKRATYKYASDQSFYYRVKYKGSSEWSNVIHVFVPQNIPKWTYTEEDLEAYFNQ